MTGNQSYALRILGLYKKEEFTEDLDIINKCDNQHKYSPLHIACMLGLTPVIEKLLELGANKEALDNNGHNLFYYLQCADISELKEYIKNMLVNDVNFFFGRYFDELDIERVLNQFVLCNRRYAYDVNELVATEENYKRLKEQGASLFKQQEFNLAIEFYELAYKLNPIQADVTCLSNIGVCYNKIGEQQQALTYFKQVLTIDPNHEKAKYYLKTYTKPPKKIKPGL